MLVTDEDLRILKQAENLADAVWALVAQWQNFARDTVGKQLIRATDSIGANIAEMYGRFNYSEKIQFLYYARGSLFEAKFWFNRAKTRELIQPDIAKHYAQQLTDLARQLNRFINSLKQNKATLTNDKNAIGKSLHEDSPIYEVIDEADQLFNDEQLGWLNG